MLVSVSLDLSDWGVISDISYGYSDFFSLTFLPVSQLTSPRPSQWSPTESELFPPRKPSDHMHTSASPEAPSQGLVTQPACVGESTLQAADSDWQREKAKADCRYDFSTLLPLMDCSRHNISNQPAQRAAL